MSIEYSKAGNDVSTDFKTQRTDQSEFDYNNVPMALNTVGNVNYNLNHSSNIPSQDDGKIILDTYSNESLKIKVTPSEGKKTIVQIIKRDESSILESSTLQIGAVIKNNDELPDDYQGDGKFHLYKNLINKEKPFRRSFSPTNKTLPRPPLDDFHPQLIKQSSTYSTKASNSGCCLVKPINDQPVEGPSPCVSVSNNPYLNNVQMENLCATQSISNNANFKILYDKPYATSEFDDQYLAKPESQPPDENLLVKCVKSVINEAAKVLQCLMCGEAFTSCSGNLINPFNTCNTCFLQKQPTIKPVEVCSSCRSDVNFPDKLVPTVSNHYEVFGPNIYRISNSPSEYSILSSDYKMVPFKHKDTLDSALVPHNEHLMSSVRTSVENKPMLSNQPSLSNQYCTCVYNSQDMPSISPLDSHIPSIEPLNAPGSFIQNNPLISANRSVSSNYFSTTQTPHSPSSNYMIDGIPSQTSAIPTHRSGLQTQRYGMSTQRSSPPSTARSLLQQKVDPQLVKESLKQGSMSKATNKIPDGVIDKQMCKFDFSQHISFDKIIKYPHVLLTIDNICNIELINRVLITSGNFVLNYKDLCLKGLRVPTINLDQTFIKLVLEVSPSTTVASRLLMHCGVAQKKKYYHVNIPLDLNDPSDSSGTLQLSVHGSNDTDQLDECYAPKLTFKLRKYTHGLYYLTCLPSLQTKFQYVSLYGDQLDEFISSVINNMPLQSRNYIFKLPSGTSYSHTINGVPCKLSFAGDVFVQNDYYQGKLVNLLQQSKPQFTPTPLSDETTPLALFELPLFTKLLENVFSEWIKFVTPSKQVLYQDDLIPTLKAHATAMVEELLIRLVEYLDGPILQPTFNKYLVPPVIYYNEENIQVDNSNCKAIFTYLWHVDSSKNFIGNTRLICKADVPATANQHKMDFESIPQIALVELSDVYNTNDGLKIVSNVIEKEVQRILSFRNGHNDFIASIKDEIKQII